MKLSKQFEQNMPKEPWQPWSQKSLESKHNSEAQKARMDADMAKYHEAMAKWYNDANVYIRVWRIVNLKE